VPAPLLALAAYNAGPTAVAAAGGRALDEFLHENAGRFAVSTDDA
jgi:soluble lytic murein transglycosylase-like protein